MKTLKKQTWVKVIAAILCFLALLSLAVEVACAAFLSASGAYMLTEEQYNEEMYDSVAIGYGYLKLNELIFIDTTVDGSILSHPDVEYFSMYWGNIRRVHPFYDTDCCRIKITRKDDGKEVFSSAGIEGERIYSTEFDIPIEYYCRNAVAPEGEATDDLKSGELKLEAFTDVFTVEVTLIRGAQPMDIMSFLLIMGEWIWQIKYSVYLFMIVSLVLTVLLWVFLCSAAGHTKQDDSIHLRFPARVPLDLQLCIVAALFILLGLLCIEIMEETILQWPLGVALCATSVMLAIAAVEWLPVSFAARVKAGKWWRNTLIFMILHFIWRILRAICRGIVSFVRKIPFIWRTLLFVAVIFLAELIAVGTSLWLLFLLLDLIILAVAVWYSVSVAKLRKSASELAAGSLGTKTDTAFMPYELKQLGRDLNSMGDGLSRAVEEKMKSERMKTELITNVSHDIKTPLTSIVNYVELLGRENLDGKAAEYVEVLSRQSKRMKKLIDDLVEASKASTGNISAELAPLDLSVMAGQTAGEYAERFAARGLRLVVSGVESPAIVRADGRLVWRIWDNLLGNVCKYAMPGTRVYLNVERRGDVIATVFRNISEQPLSKSGEELTERFVRGDNSRSGEGSGLGLSIAAGLAAVQGGTLSITADGDLFKAEVCLPAITDGSADAKTAPAQRTPVDPVSASPASAAPAYTAPAPVNIPVHVRPQTPSPVVSSQPERQEATCDTAPCNTTAAVAPSAADTAEESAPAETESTPETADSPADSKADDSADIQ